MNYGLNWSPPRNWEQSYFFKGFPSHSQCWCSGGRYLYICWNLCHKINEYLESLWRWKSPNKHQHFIAVLFHGVSRRLAGNVKLCTIWFHYLQVLYLVVDIATRNMTEPMENWMTICVISHNHDNKQKNVHRHIRKQMGGLFVLGMSFGIREHFYLLELWVTISILLRDTSLVLYAEVCILAFSTEIFC